MKARRLSLSLATILITSLIPLGARPAAAVIVCSSDLLQFVILEDYQPPVSRDAGGDTVELTGIGFVGGYFGDSFPVEGRFVHKNAAGQTLRQGTWTAERQLKWQFYGCEENTAFIDGRVLLKVRLVASDGAEFTGYLDVESPEGTQAPPGAIGGFRLSVKAWGLFFDEPIGGRVFFTYF